MTKNITYWTWVLIMVAIPFIYTSLVYGKLPANIPTHFNIKGEADGYGGKENIFLLPVIFGFVSFIVFGLLSNLKKIDPKRYEKTDEGFFGKFGLFMVAFLTSLSLIITYSSTNQNAISINKLIFPLLGAGFMVMGIYMPKIPQNYFVGFRLPWTLESIDNWRATHEFCGKVWLGGGFVIVVTSLFLKPEVFGIIFLILIGLMVVIPVVYSYRKYRLSQNNFS